MAGVPPRDAEVWESPRSKVYIWWPSPKVVRFKYYGFNEAQSVPWIEKTIGKVIDEGRTPIEMFVDCEDEVGYEPAFRKLLTEWNKRIEKDIVGINLFITSKIAAMGIAAGNLLLGGMLKPFTDRREFDMAAQAATRHDSTRPGPPEA